VRWFSTPEAQATIIVGIIAIVVQPIFLYAAFQFGKAQARAQVRHQKAVEAIVRALRIIEQLQLKFRMWVRYKERDELEIEYAKEISRLRDELRDLVYDNSPWFEPHTKDKVRLILAEIRLYYGEYADALQSGDPARVAQTGKRISEWSEESYPLRVIELEDEARRLIGTKRHWRYTRRGRVVVWLRQNTVWLAAVPLPILFVILVSTVVFYLLVTR
jgi:hypothetical protein